jgi:hypothetical protein
MFNLPIQLHLFGKTSLKTTTSYYGRQITRGLKPHISCWSEEEKCGISQFSNQKQNTRISKFDNPSSEITRSAVHKRLTRGNANGDRA